jgi:uncharacterized membrane protein (UPF0136 family)
MKSKSNLQKTAKTALISGLCLGGAFLVFKGLIFAFLLFFLAAFLLNQSGSSILWLALPFLIIVIVIFGLHALDVMTRRPKAEKELEGKE